MPLHPRVIHLIGGLRAVDNCSGIISIHIDAARKLGEFVPNGYAETYSDLNYLGLQPLGVEFPNDLSLSGQIPEDWQFFSKFNDFELMEERDAWSNIRYAASKDGNSVVFDYAARAASYLDLLSIRILQLSNAYSQMLSGNSEPKPNQFYSSWALSYIDAAIHAFLADAACLRDFIAEITWDLILKGTPKHTTLRKFITNAKNEKHFIATEILTAADDGGWIKVLSSLRNHIIHVAPLSRRSSFHMCQIREIKKGDVHVPILHYPLLSISDGSLWDFESVDLRSIESLRAGKMEYRKFSETSHDALSYLCDVLSKLIALLRKIRLELKLRSERIVITDADVIGKITVK